MKQQPLSAANLYKTLVLVFNVIGVNIAFLWNLSIASAMTGYGRFPRLEEIIVATILTVALNLLVASFISAIVWLFSKKIDLEFFAKLIIAPNTVLVVVLLIWYFFVHFMRATA